MMNAIRTASRVRQRLWSGTFLCTSEKNDFIRGDASSTDLAHRPDEVVMVRGVHEFSWSELGSAVRAQNVIDSIAVPGCRAVSSFTVSRAFIWSLME